MSQWLEHNHCKSLDVYNQYWMSLCLMCVPVKCEICINTKQCIHFEVSWSGTAQSQKHSMSPEQDRRISAHFSNWNVLWKNDADETSADSHLTPGSLLRAEKRELLIKTLKSSEIITEGFFEWMTSRPIIVSTIFYITITLFYYF